MCYKNMALSSLPLSSLKLSNILFGKILTSEKNLNNSIKKVAKVAIGKYIMDERLNMFFKEKIEVYAFDTTQNKECDEGDYVLIREFPESEDKNVKYNIEKLVYKRGNFIDPLSGKKCTGTEYSDQIERMTELFGYKKEL